MGDVRTIIIADWLPKYNCRTSASSLSRDNLQVV
jgi:hypothetical protein